MTAMMIPNGTAVWLPPRPTSGATKPPMTNVIKPSRAAALPAVLPWFCSANDEVDTEMGPMQATMRKNAGKIK
ncbi:hypothetical protein D3C71_1922180 [compost metagenome]